MTNVTPRRDRITRFVDDDSLNSHICTFDPEKNILRIARKYYDLLTEPEQKLVWRSVEDLDFDKLALRLKQRRQGKF